MNNIFSSYTKIGIVIAIIMLIMIVVQKKDALVKFFKKRVQSCNPDCDCE